MTAILDLCDLNITARGISPPLPAQPGYAYLSDRGDPVLGLEAIAHARLNPTRINNRFWSELNTDPNGSSHPKVRHNADLAWHHLKALALDSHTSDLAVCVPSSYSETDLKLLAGIFQSLDIGVKAFVNRAVATGLEYQSSVNAVYVDLQQHQTILTFLDGTENELNKVNMERLPAQGLVRLQNRWLHIIRERFISSSRFDPMHSGDTEQQLFSQLYEQFGSVIPGVESASTSYEFRVSHNQQQYVEQFSTDEFAIAYKDWLLEVESKAQGLPLILDHHFTGLPGVELSSNIRLAGSESLFHGAQQICANLPAQSEDIAYFESAPLGNPGLNTNQTGPSAVAENSHSATNTDNEPAPATHILYQGYAYPADNCEITLVNNGLQIQIGHSNGNSYFTQVDGQLRLGVNADQLTINDADAIPGKPLFPGDRIGFSGVAEQITAIAFGEADSR